MEQAKLNRRGLEKKKAPSRARSRLERALEKMSCLEMRLGDLWVRCWIDGIRGGLAAEVSGVCSGTTRARCLEVRPTGTCTAAVFVVDAEMTSSMKAGLATIGRSSAPSGKRRSLRRTTTLDPTTGQRSIREVRSSSSRRRRSHRSRTRCRPTRRQDLSTPCLNRCPRHKSRTPPSSRIRRLESRVSTRSTAPTCGTSLGQPSDLSLAASRMRRLTF